jgi:zinc and cadmium transporter
MPLFWWVLAFSVIGGVFSLIGGLLLLKNDRWVNQNTLIIVSWAAGVLLSVAFLDLMPEAVEMGLAAGFDLHSLFIAALLAVIGFFIFERSFVWFHHHHELQFAPPVNAMLIFGDSVHNFIDGVIIGAAFLVSIPTGVATALAVGAHEIPQEIADFGVLLKSGMARLKVVLLNLFSALMTLVGSLGVLLFSRQITAVIPYLLAFAAGMFTYIACSDLIPELHHAKSRSVAVKQLISFLIGIVTTYLLVSLTHAG